MRRTASSASGEIACWRFALRLATGILGHIRHDEERAAGMDPAGRFQDRPRLAIGLVELVVSAIGVGLENPGVVGQMRLGMLAGAVARVIEHRRRRRGAAERPIVAHIDPTSPGVGLAFGQDRHGGVIAMQSLGREDMRFDPPEERLQHRAAGPDLIGQGRQAERHAFPGVAFGLAVERLMLPELLEQDHRQQAGTGPAAGDHMERRRRLADLLAVPAGELLADMLDHLPLARDHLQRLGDGPRPACAAARRRSKGKRSVPARSPARAADARGTACAPDACG